MVARFPPSKGVGPRSVGSVAGTHRSPSGTEWLAEPAPRPLQQSTVSVGGGECMSASGRSEKGANNRSVSSSSAGPSSVVRGFSIGAVASLLHSEETASCVRKIWTPPGRYFVANSMRLLALLISILAMDSFAWAQSTPDADFCVGAAGAVDDRIWFGLVKMRWVARTPTADHDHEIHGGSSHLRPQPGRSGATPSPDRRVGRRRLRSIDPRLWRKRQGK
jgi:hypothetical protein